MVQLFYSPKSNGDNLQSKHRMEVSGTSSPTSKHLKMSVDPWHSTGYKARVEGVRFDMIPESNPHVLLCGNQFVPRRLCLEKQKIYFGCEKINKKPAFRV